MTAAGDPRSEPEIDEALEQSFPRATRRRGRSAKRVVSLSKKQPGPICSSKYRHAGLFAQKRAFYENP
jgi:hypothetical protein